MSSNLQYRLAVLSAQWAVYEKRKESADKEYRLQYTEEKLPFIFPGISWLLQQRPPDVVPMDDHTTGLCKVKFEKC